jgi:hypothetical protein
MANRWTNFVKMWSAKNNISYMCALSNPRLKKDYNTYKLSQSKEGRKQIQKEKLIKEKGIILNI